MRHQIRPIGGCQIGETARIGDEKPGGVRSAWSMRHSRSSALAGLTPARVVREVESTPPPTRSEVFPLAEPPTEPLEVIA